MYENYRNLRSTFPVFNFGTPIATLRSKRSPIQMERTMENDGRKRVVIENLQPSIECGRYPVKRCEGELVTVSADIICDSHDRLDAMLLFRREDQSDWDSLPLYHKDNDRWESAFVVPQSGTYLFTVRAWVDHFGTWQHFLARKVNADQDISIDLQAGAIMLEGASKRVPPEFSRPLLDRSRMILDASEPADALLLATDKEITAVMRAYPDLSLSSEYSPYLKVNVDSKKAVFSTWYELFPRSCGSEKSLHGTFRDCERKLAQIAEMGFDVLYLPPIHPIGITNRKGRNNSTEAGMGDPGSPWAIGSSDGGHKSIEPALGGMEDFVSLINAAASYGIEIALDIAFQCSPDHPYVKEHPEWFKKRPDGTIQFAENPPKRYEDIVPFDFECEDWEELWNELKSVVLFWIDKGVRIFRVDNPHTKPFPFWEWLISEVRNRYPEVIFLAEAFTRPKIMNRLAKIGFNQSYTYFTWRNTKEEITSYFRELTKDKPVEYLRPNLWPNTPDILPEYLQAGGLRASAVRLVLAATLSSSYGIYGPVFENAVTSGVPGTEEYIDSEKYEIKSWKEENGPLKNLISKINRARRENSALQEIRNLLFYPVDNDYLLFYGKSNSDRSNIILVVVNLDPFHSQSGILKFPYEEFSIDASQPVYLEDLLSGEHFVWNGSQNSITLDPEKSPAFVFSVQRQLRQETQFEYY